MKGNAKLLHLIINLLNWKTSWLISKKFKVTYSFRNIDSNKTDWNKTQRTRVPCLQCGPAGKAERENIALTL